jgi:hypothetical protein
MSVQGSGFDPRAFWSDLVSGSGGLENVGHPRLGVYNAWAYRFRLAALQKVLAPGTLAGARVFEAAFGEGFYLKHWRRAGVSRVDGMDISPRAVASATSAFPEFGLRCGDLADDASFQGLARYDVVTAIDVLYHIPDATAWTRALGNLLDLVDEDGVFITTDKFPASGSYQKYPHVKRRSLAMWRDELGAKGFKIHRILPVFLLMDDPITFGENPGLGRLAAFQWKVLTEPIKALKGVPKLQSLLASAIAAAQYLPERVAMSLLRRTPNLELLVCTREGGG